MTRQPRNTEQSRAFVVKQRRAAKALGACGYTPMISKTMASIFCELSEGPEARKSEVLTAITKIVRGK